MHWTSSLSREPELAPAIREITASAHSTLGGPPDLIFLFASEHHRAGFDELPAQVRTSLGGGVLIGCSASGVIGGDEEIEFKPALGLRSAHTDRRQCRRAFHAARAGRHGDRRHRPDHRDGRRVLLGPVALAAKFATSANG